MLAYMNRQYLYEVSIGLGKQSYENENEWLNDGDGAFGAIGLALSPSLYYLIGSAEYPKEVLTKLDRTFGKHNEDHNSALARVFDPKVSASSLSDEVFQYEEEAESSTQSIRIEESILEVNPSPDAP